MPGSHTVHLLLTQLRNVVYSRSYAEDVTSVTSGASQGPHSFNLVFVCLCVCVFVSRLVLSVSDGKKA